MNYAEINKLLDKYWEAETSLQDEKILISYFKSKEVAPDHLQYRDLFQYYDYAANIQLEAKISSLPERSVFALRKNFMGIAASLLLMISAGFFIVNNYMNNQSYNSNSIVITEEEEALRITKDALAFLSIKLDESSRNITSDIQKMERVSILK